MGRLVLFLFIITSFTGCLNKRIEITAEYITNANWDKYANAIKVTKLKLKKDSTINPFSRLNQNELMQKLEDDSSFIFVGNVKDNGESYATRRVFFNRKENFFWWPDKGEMKSETIGSLQKNNWYRFSRLVTYPYYVYVYIDSINQTHRFNVNLANY